jgi:hypothetical protein
MIIAPAIKEGVKGCLWDSGSHKTPNSSLESNNEGAAAPNYSSGTLWTAKEGPPTARGGLPTQYAARGGQRRPLYPQHTQQQHTVRPKEGRSTHNIKREVCSSKIQSRRGPRHTKAAKGEVHNTSRLVNKTRLKLPANRRTMIKQNLKVVRERPLREPYQDGLR